MAKVNKKTVPWNHKVTITKTMKTIKDVKATYVLNEDGTKEKIKEEVLDERTEMAGYNMTSTLTKPEDKNKKTNINVGALLNTAKNILYTTKYNPKTVYSNKPRINTVAHGVANITGNHPNIKPPAGNNTRPDEKADKKKDWRAKDIVMFLRASLHARIKQAITEGPSEDPNTYITEDVTRAWDYLDRDKPIKTLEELDDLDLDFI